VHEVVAADGETIAVAAEDEDVQVVAPRLMPAANGRARPWM
jgi:hypothetical protein